MTLTTFPPLHIYYQQQELILCHPEARDLQDPNSIQWFGKDPAILGPLPDFFDRHPNIHQLHVPTTAPIPLLEKIAAQHKVIHAAGGLVQNEQGAYLLIHRHHRWDLPKGKQEIGESIEETALREVEEECGIRSLLLEEPICTTYHTYRMYGETCFKYTHWFSMRSTGNQTLRPQSEEDITDAVWLSNKELPKVLQNTYPSILEVFQQARLT